MFVYAKPSCRPCARPCAPSALHLIVLFLAAPLLLRVAVVLLSSLLPFALIALAMSALFWHPDPVLFHFTKKDCQAKRREAQPPGKAIPAAAKSEKFDVTIPAPGIAQEDVQAEVNHENVLIIQAETDSFHGEHRARFCRAIRLPASVDVSSLAIEVTNGLVRVTAGKKQPIKVAIVPPAKSEPVDAESGTVDDADAADANATSEAEGDGLGDGFVRVRESK